MDISNSYLNFFVEDIDAVDFENVQPEDVESKSMQDPTALRINADIVIELLWQYS